MWFRNLQIYRLTQPFELSAEELHERLQAASFHRCGRLEMASQGWVAPLGRHGSQLSHETGGRIMVCMRREEKVLPGAVIQEIVAEKVEEIEAGQARTVRRKERNTLREEVLLDLLPRAFSRSVLTYAYLAPGEGWIVVDAASAKKAEELISLLRSTLGSLPVAPLRVDQSPAEMMTAWLLDPHRLPDFEIQDECELRDVGAEGGVVRCRRQDLTGEEIRAHLDAGKQVVQLAIVWDERLACLLTEELAVKRLRFLDLVQEEAAEVEAEDEATRFDADFALMSLEISRFLSRIMAVFGGESMEEIPQGKTAVTG